jgi:hypothetical protein
MTLEEDGMLKQSPTLVRRRVHNPLQSQTRI